jgi:RNA polymerase sigma factor (sigma-70 family)
VSAITQHDGLVHRVAQRYRWACGASIDYEDLIQAGRLGVLRALRTYDPAKGKPSTYIMLWVRDAIVREVRDNSRTIRVPDHVWRKGTLPPAAAHGVDLDAVPEPEPGNTDTLDAVADAVAALPAPHAAAIRRRYYQGVPSRTKRMERAALEMLREALSA